MAISQEQEQQRASDELLWDAQQAAERQRLEEAALPVMLDAMWAANVLDIESTVRSVCKKVGLWLGRAYSYGPRTREPVLRLSWCVTRYVTCCADPGRRDRGQGSPQEASTGPEGDGADLPGVCKRGAEGPGGCCQGRGLCPSSAAGLCPPTLLT